MSGRLIGYARVSTNEQNLDLQIESLLQAGCNEDMIFTDQISGAKSHRPGLEQCINTLQSGDTLLVWRLDRLGRSMQHLVNLITELIEKNIDFCSIQDGAIDTTTASGELMFHIFSALAQFERRIIQERTHAGLSVARARGRKGGRRAIEKNDPKVITAKKLYQDKSLTPDQICNMMKISRSTFYRYVSI